MGLINYNCHEKGADWCKWKSLLLWRVFNLPKVLITYDAAWHYIIHTCPKTCDPYFDISINEELMRETSKDKMLTFLRQKIKYNLKLSFNVLATEIKKRHRQ